MDKRVLLIDFDPVAAELTGALLATRGIPFTLARSHAELDRALAAGTPALVVIDPARPDENEGMRLCASLAERLGPAGRVPIILASRSLHGARWKALARDAGAELFLERPKDDRLLLAAAERAMGQAGAAPPVPAPAPSSLPSAVRTTAPPTAGAITTAGAQRIPPPAENELENMVDQMFAQWFADADAVAPQGAGSATGPRTGGVGPVVERGPTGSVATTARAAAVPASRDTGARTAAPSARNSGTGAAAALLERPEPAGADVERIPTGRVKSSATATLPSAAPPAVAPQHPGPTPGAALPASVAPHPGPTPGVALPASAAARPVPPVAGLPQVRPAPAPAPPAGPTLDAAPAVPGVNLKRPVAIAAAFALIGIGVAFVALQKFGGTQQQTADTAVSAPQEALPVDSQPAAEGPVVADATAANSPANEAKKPPVAPLPVPPTPTSPARPAAEAPPATRQARDAAPSTGEVALARPAPSAGAAPPAAPPAALTPPPTPWTTAPAATATPEAKAAPPVPQPEAEFIPDVVPDGTLPAAPAAPEASPARYVGPELIAASRATPTFPPGARQMRMSGQVRLQVKVRPDGSVGAVSVLSEPKPVAGFGKAAEAAVRQWRYRPATLGGRAVESEIAVVVNFSGE